MPCCPRLLVLPPVLVLGACSQHQARLSFEPVAFSTEISSAFAWLAGGQFLLIGCEGGEFAAGFVDSCWQDKAAPFQ